MYKHIYIYYIYIYVRRPSPTAAAPRRPWRRPSAPAAPLARHLIEYKIV